MLCPPDRQPFRLDRDGTPLPLFVPAAQLAAALVTWPRMWVAPEPGPRPYGRAWTAADLRPA